MYFSQKIVHRWVIFWWEFKSQRKWKQFVPKPICSENVIGHVRSSAKGIIQIIIQALQRKVHAVSRHMMMMVAMMMEAVVVYWVVLVPSLARRQAAGLKSHLRSALPLPSTNIFALPLQTYLHTCFIVVVNHRNTGEDCYAPISAIKHTKDWSNPMC